MSVALKVSCAALMPARAGLRVAAGLACLVALVVGAPAARANHTPVPGTVALVGSLQSELGCPGDWQPECPQTRLQPVAGSPGVFRATFDVPAGSYEYKVALNNSLDENYGAGGVPGGANIADHRARRTGDVHLRPRHARHQRRHAPAAAGRAAARTGCGRA